MWNIFSILLLFFICPPFESKCKQSSPNPWPTLAIYLTIGTEAQEVDQQWGGCHITMAGFHPLHSDEIFLQKIPQILQENSTILKGWRPKNVKLEKWGKQWVVIIHSKTLNKITRELERHGFKKIKGPAYTKVPFHMVLPHLHTQKAAEAYVEILKNKPWFITTVKNEPSSGRFNWLKYYRL